ncbi:MAG: DUF4349 domain-containing protein [Bacteroidota bacterium]|nr:DUF4349 domain-containing protein [Bacteroidota bacterium]
MKTQNVLLVFLSVMMFNGCFNKSKNVSREMSMPNITDTDQPERKRDASNDKIKQSDGVLTNVFYNKPVAENIPSSINRMIIKSGNMNIEIDKFDESEKIINEEVSKVKGYITNSHSSLDASGNKQGVIAVRIPSDNFDLFIQRMSMIGKVMSQQISGNDVTEEYIDLEARQTTQKELERRLLELLSEKTANLTDVVEVEEKLSAVRGNIERTEGRMKFLKDQSAFSTLNVSLFEPSLLQTSSGGGFFYEIGQAFKKGLSGFTEVLSGLVTFMVAFSPVLIFAFVIFLIIKKILLNRKKRVAGIQVNAG